MTQGQRDEILAQLHEDLQVNKHILQDVKNEILEAGVSNYPILVAYEFDMDLGKKLIDKNEMELHWHYAASHLEEFYNKQIIAANRIDEFRNLYKSHHDNLCLFVIVDDEGEFVFLNPQVNKDEF
ncbi:MAG: hypothetical protein LRY27_01165 [Chitinophagales bacterium]|nr:hypothetical protein [Chitinophagales bacterium]